MNRFRVILGVGLVVSFVTICLTASFSDLPPGANELSDIIRPPRLCTSTSELPSNNIESPVTWKPSSRLILSPSSSNIFSNSSSKEPDSKSILPPSSANPVALESRIMYAVSYP